jgi:hypothetical protein
MKTLLLFLLSLSALFAQGSGNNTLGNAGITNPTITVNGSACTLGGGCSITAPASSMTVGTTTISGGSSGRIQFNNAGLLGELSTTGTGNAVLAASPALTGTPTGPTASAGDNTTQLATDAFVTSAVNNAIAGVNPAVAVNAATTSAGNTSGFTYNNGVGGVGATFTGSTNTAVVIDGFTFTALGQRLLVKNDTQSPSGAFNGVYFVTQLQTGLLPPILTRSLDYDQPSDMNNTGAIPVISGTVNTSTSWLLTSSVTTVGTSPLAYTQFSINPTTLAKRICIIDNDTQITTAPLLAANFSGRCVIPVAATIIEVDVIGGTGILNGTAASLTLTGTGSIQIGKQGTSSSTGLLSAALATVGGVACALPATSGACALNGGTTSSSSVTIATTALAAGDVLYVSAAIADGTQTWFVVTVIYAVN